MLKLMRIFFVSPPPNPRQRGKTDGTVGGLYSFPPLAGECAGLREGKGVELF